MVKLAIQQTNKQSNQPTNQPQGSMSFLRAHNWSGTQELPIRYWTRRSIITFTKKLISILSQMSSVQTTSSHFSKIHQNINLTSASMWGGWSRKININKTNKLHGYQSASKLSWNTFAASANINNKNKTFVIQNYPLLHHHMHCNPNNSNFKIDRLWMVIKLPFYHDPLQSTVY